MMHQTIGLTGYITTLSLTLVHYPNSPLVRCFIKYTHRCAS